MFNVLGPLANPAGARDGVFGVYSAALARTYAGRSPASARARLRRPRRRRARRAVAVGPNLVVEVVDGAIRDWELDPRSLGIYPRPRRAAGGSAAENADAVRRVLAGEPGGRRDAVLLNAGAALVAAGLAADVGEGVEIAAAAIDSGAAAATLERLVAFSNEVAV